MAKMISEQRSQMQLELIAVTAEAVIVGFETRNAAIIAHTDEQHTPFRIRKGGYRLDSDLFQFFIHLVSFHIPSDSLLELEAFTFSLANQHLKIIRAVAAHHTSFGRTA